MILYLQLHVTHEGEYSDLCINHYNQVVLRSMSTNTTSLDTTDSSLYSFTMHDMDTMNTVKTQVVFPFQGSGVKRRSYTSPDRSLVDEGDEPICFDISRGTYITTARHAILMVGMKLVVLNTKSDPNFNRVDFRNSSVAYSVEEDIIAALDNSKNAVVFIRPAEERIMLMFGSDHLCRPGYLGFMRVKHHTYVVISDSGHNCIKVCNLAGDVKKIYGHVGSGDAQLRCPAGLCVDPNGKIIVADRVNKRIVCFWTEHQPEGKDYWQCILDKDDLKGLVPVCVDICAPMDALVVMTKEITGTYTKTTHNKILVFKGLAAIMTAQPVLKASTTAVPPDDQMDSSEGYHSSDYTTGATAEEILSATLHALHVQL